MKIEKLKLENFKIFESQEFNFRKLTLLTGANSSGKSTVLNAIASVIQGSNSKPFPFYYNNYGENIHLGGFKDIVNNSTKALKFGIGVDYKLQDQIQNVTGSFRYASNGNQILLDELHATSSIGEIEVKWFGSSTGYKALKKPKLNQNRINETTYELLLSSLTDIFSTTDFKANKMLIETKSKDKKVLNKHLMELLKKMHTGDNVWEEIKTNNSKDIYTALEKNVLFMQDIRAIKRGIDELCSHTFYIGPIRPYPSRQYFLQSNINRLDSLGLNSFQMLIEWYKSDTKKYKKVTSDLNYLELADELYTDAIKDELIEFSVKPFNHKEGVNLSDVGFGLSQILPVVIANEACPLNSTLLINQPEVHLHPSSQARLGNFFAKESQKRNYIIETHSEYLINRLRLLVAQSLISPDEILINYIDNVDGSPKVYEIEIASNGALFNAPKSFFETYYADNSDLIFSSVGMFDNDK